MYSFPSVLPVNTPNAGGLRLAFLSCHMYFPNTGAGTIEREAYRNGTWRGPSCHQCGSIIELNVDGGEGFYVKTMSLSSFFSLARGNGRKPPKWMKEIIFKAYKGKCSLCPTILSSDEATADHIVALS